MQQKNDTQDNDIIFPVSNLHIQLDTNTGKDGESKIELFKRSMIKMPEMDVPPILNSELPFFTKNVRYPLSIQDAGWSEKYNFFFNRDLFVGRLREHIESYPSSYKDIFKLKKELEKNKNTEELQKLNNWIKDTEIHNIMITLRSIFPIPEVFGKSLKNSFQHILNQENNSRIIWDVDIKNTLNIFGFMYKFGIASKKKEEYFINIDGKRYSVEDVIWENDVVNHPIYNKFLMKLRETYEDASKFANEIEDKYELNANDLANELINDLKKETFKPPIQPDIKGLIKNIKSKTDALKLDKQTSMRSGDRKRIGDDIENRLKYIINTANQIMYNRDQIAESFITISENIRSHAKSINSYQTPNSIFMDESFEKYFEKMVEKSIKVVASRRVLDFAEKYIPLKLSNKNADGTDISSIAVEINNYIKKYFPNETVINNELSESVNNVYEPNRKTSNRVLYEELKQFKFGKSKTDDTTEKINVFDKIYNKYISIKRMSFDEKTRNKIEECLYTGIDEVNTSSSSTTSEKTERNAFEIYVRLDLVNADSFEKTSSASCKLLDKELEQEFMYLADPRNKDNMVLNRFRNLDFDSILPNTMLPVVPESKKKKGGKLNNFSRRIRSTQQYKTLKTYR